MFIGDQIYIGKIEFVAGENYQDRWIALIAKHGHLAAPAPVHGINPFTRQPIEIKASPTWAHVRADGQEAGSIYEAQDGSPFLNVLSMAGREESVAKIAEEIASLLGARFTRE